MTVISVTLGVIPAVFNGSFNWLLYILTAAGMLLVHGATNVINDYFDVKNKVDREDSPTARYRPHFLLTGELTLGKVLTFSIVMYGLAAAIAVYLILLRGLPVLLIAAVGGSLSFFYTGGPVKYKYRALGEIAVFLAWGPLMVLGAFFVQTGAWDGFVFPLWLSLPQGIWVTLVILANNIKDIDYDGSVGIKTVGTKLSRKKAYSLYLSLIIIVYALIALETILGVIPLLTLITFASLPPVIKLLSVLRTSEEVPPDADPRTAQAGMIFGILLILGLLVSLLIGL
jgi:1,4-dihydroxy-2-naphthoate polyprenyltransferase